MSVTIVCIELYIEHELHVEIYYCTNMTATLHG